MLDQSSLRDGLAKPADLVALRSREPGSVGLPWRRTGIGLCALAVLMALGWTAFRFLPEHDRSADEVSDVRQTEAADAYPESGSMYPEAMPAEEQQTAASDWPLPPDDASFLAAPPDFGPPESPSFETLVRLDRGDTFAGVLGELGFAARDIAAAVAALVPHVTMKRLPIGQAFTVTAGSSEAGADARPLLLALTIRPEPRREITLERDDTGDYIVEFEDFEVVSRLRRVAGTVDGSVIASAEAAGVSRSALAEMLRAFSWDVNFQHDIKVGDRFDVLIEQSWTSDGQEVDSGRVLWAELTTGGGANSHAVYRFKPRRAAEFFYTPSGDSVVRAFLRTPLNMSRVSSGFGMRRHPVLGFTRLHAGVDFAAPSGTPILAAGAGRIVWAGRKGGYGKWVKISHAGGLATGYAHMSRIASGIRRGARVRQGQVIGFVGSTGLSTGPHLHFELHRKGRRVNPLSVARRTLRSRLAGDDLARFKARMAEIDRMRLAADGEHQPGK